MGTWKWVVSLGNCSLGIGFLQETGKGLEGESGAKSPKGLWVLFCRPGGGGGGLGAFEVFNWGVLKSVNKVTLKPR